MIKILKKELQEVARALSQSSFSTYDFILKLKEMFPNTWQSIENEYGKGGAGAGRNYSAYSRVASSLNGLSKTEYIAKIGARPSPEGWGHPLITYWAFITSEQDYPDEVPDTVTEGAKKTLLVNRYERDSSAKLKCIRKWGVACTVCNFNFEKQYGNRGAGYIHVHHLVPLSEIREEYQLDPIKDLRPVCANCHAMLHRTIPAISIKELKSLLKLKYAV